MGHPAYLRDTSRMGMWATRPKKPGYHGTRVPGDPKLQTISVTLVPLLWHLLALTQ